MAKKYDIVQTSKMSAEYDASLIVGSCVAGADLENGRLVVASESAKTANYPSAITDTVLLHASVERMYEDYLGLTEFKVLKDGMPRLFRMQVGDVFITTAIDYNGDRANFTAIEVGDIAVTHATDGLLSVLDVTTVTTSVFKAEVLEKTTLGYDKIPAIKVKVIAS